MAYKQIADGEMVEVPSGVPLQVVCCDCGLVHKIEFSRPVTTRWSRLDKITKRYRKRHAAKLPCVPREK